MRQTRIERVTFRFSVTELRLQSDALPTELLTRWMKFGSELAVLDGGWGGGFVSRQDGKEGGRVEEG